MGSARAKPAKRSAPERKPPRTKAAQAEARRAPKPGKAGKSPIEPTTKRKATTKPKSAPKPKAAPKPKTTPKPKLAPTPKPIPAPDVAARLAEAKSGYVLAYTDVSGRTLASSVYVGTRQPRGEGGSEVESWVGHFQNGRVKCFYEHLAGAWVSDTGRIVLATVAGTIIRYEDTLFEGTGLRNTVPGAVEGVWGFDDDTTFVWSRLSDTEQRLSDASGAPLPHPNDGRSPGDPTLYVMQMHGSTHDEIYAACWNGLARWDGWGWQHTPLPATSVFAAGEDEVYVCTRAGELHRGGRDRFELLAKGRPGSLGSVAKFGGHVFVLSEEEGLRRYDPEKRALTPFKPNIRARSLEARGELLIATRNRLVWTRDGEHFFGRRGMLEEMTAEEPFLGQQGAGGMKARKSS